MRQMTALRWQPKPAGRNPCAIILNSKFEVARFASPTLAIEAFYDLGCYIEEIPEEGDVFEIVNLKTGEVVDPVLVGVDR